MRRKKKETITLKGHKVRVWYHLCPEIKGEKKNMWSEGRRRGEVKRGAFVCRNMHIECASCRKGSKGNKKAGSSGARDVDCSTSNKLQKEDAVCEADAP